MERQNWKNVSLLLLSIALLISIVVNFMLARNGSNNFAEHLKRDSVENLKVNLPRPQRVDIGPVNEDNARRNVDLFRTKLPEEGQGLFYTVEEIRYYIDSVYPRILASQKTHMGSNADNYNWGIGCYWMKNLNLAGVEKSDFCFVPTAVNKTGGKKVEDFFTSAIYGKNLRTSVPSQGGGAEISIQTSVYNTGTMFP